MIYLSDEILPTLFELECVWWSWMLVSDYFGLGLGVCLAVLSYSTPRYKLPPNLVSPLNLVSSLANLYTILAKIVK